MKRGLPLVCAAALIAGCGSTAAKPTVKAQVRAICAQVSSDVRARDADEHRLLPAYNAGTVSALGLFQGLSSDLTVVGNVLRRGETNLRRLQGGDVLASAVGAVAAATSTEGKATGRADRAGVQAAAKASDNAIDRVNADARKLGLSACLT